ncbi:MAG TPA: DUF488 family protein [Luteolibacter sp.]
MVKTKSTEDPISSGDGLRLFVTRYWPRGHRREECDEWIPSLAPSEALLHRFQNGEIDWRQFEREYRSEMLKGYSDESGRNGRMPNSGQKYFLRLLRKIAEKKTITLICTCPPDAVHCHRLILREWLSSDKGV